MRRSLLLLPLLLGACSLPTMRPTVQALSELDAGQAVVVGRLRMDPPFVEAEKDMTARGTIVVGADRMKTHLWVLVGPGKYQGEDAPGTEHYNGAIETPWDRFFYSRFDRKDHVLQMAVVAMTLSQRAYYPLNLKVAIEPGDQVVYIGDIELRRDDFNNPAGLRVKDGYHAALTEIRGRFGRKVSVRKALARPLP